MDYVKFISLKLVRIILSCLDKENKKLRLQSAELLTLMHALPYRSEGNGSKRIQKFLYRQLLP